MTSACFFLRSLCNALPASWTVTTKKKRRMHPHPLGHISLGMRNYETAKRFYGATRALLGRPRVHICGQGIYLPTSHETKSCTIGCCG